MRGRGAVKAGASGGFVGGGFAVPPGRGPETLANARTCRYER